MRNSSCYGLGAFAQYTKNNFEKYYKDIITILVSAINLPIDKNLSKDDKSTKQFAKDNAVSALGKIIKYHEKELGSDYENIFNLGQIIIILAKAYNSEMSDELLDTNIEQFALGVKNSKEYNDILVNLMSKQKGKTLNRIKSLFKI